MLRLAASLLILNALKSSAQETPTAQFFLLERSVRSEGLGGVSAALHGETGLFANPALVTELRRPAAVAGGYLRRVQDGNVAFTSLGAVFPDRLWSLGGSVSYMGVTVDGYDESGAAAASASETNLSGRLLVARRARSVSWGLAPKLLKTKLQAGAREASQTIWAADAGLLIRTGSTSDLRFGAMIENAGPAKDGFPMPTRARVGIAGRPADFTNVLAAFDAAVTMTGSRRSEGALGLEWSQDRFLSRLGARFERLRASGITVTPTIGLGFDAEQLAIDLSFGMTAAHFDSLVARAALLWRFGRSRKK